MVKESVGQIAGAMFFFTLVGLLFFTYYLICLVLWIALDSDVETFFKSLVGKKISECTIIIK